MGRSLHWADLGAILQQLVGFSWRVGGKCSESQLTLGKRPEFLWKTENLETEAL